jgi:hypothetical protein
VFDVVGLNYIIDTSDDKVCKEILDDGSGVMFMSYDVSKPPPLTNYQRRQGFVDSEPAVVGVSQLNTLISICS